MMEGIFTISLDFELHWGVFDISKRQDRMPNYENTIKIIVPQMLELFEKYNVHATWATVGGMFAENKEDWEALNPLVLPQFTSYGNSVYKWVEKNGLDAQFAIAHFAADTIRNIDSSDGQEIGTHLFSHMYCNELINREEAFREDLRAVMKSAARLNIEPISLTFPRNQIRQDLLKICYEEGIRAVRTNPLSWYFRKSNSVGTRVLRMFAREFDTYLPLGTSMLYSLADLRPQPQHPVQIPRGRFFVAWKPENKYHNIPRVKRMISEIHAAAKHKKCYHLWWHPEDFSFYPEENLKSLEAVLKAYKFCKEKHGMVSWNMGEYTKHLSF